MLGDHGWNLNVTQTRLKAQQTVIVGGNRLNQMAAVVVDTDVMRPFQVLNK